MSQAFQGLEKLVFLDSSDLDFKDDILNLWQQFDHMGAGEIVGMGLDMSPHYRSFLQENYTKSVPCNPMILKHILQDPSLQPPWPAWPEPRCQQWCGALPAGQDEGECSL